MQSTLAVVSLSAIRSNARALIRAANAPLIAVVKDDAYGHGARAVCEALSDMVCMFAVSTVQEGAELVHGGVQKDILVLTPPMTRAEARRAHALGLTVAATSFSALRLLKGLGVRAHLAVNTGMNRYGFSPSALPAAVEACTKAQVAVEGVFSHFYEPSCAAARREQEAAFSAAAACVRERFPAALRHLSATGGIAAGAAAYDCVRAGLGLYGYLPQGAERIRVRPAMKIYAYVSHGCKAEGGGLGYQRAARRYQDVHTLRVGYGDGFFRSGGLDAEGALCMDACVREGAMPFGRRVCVLDDAQAYAREHQTTAYEVLVRAGGGAEKRYVR